MDKRRGRGRAAEIDTNTFLICNLWRAINLSSRSCMRYFFMDFSLSSPRIWQQTEGELKRERDRKRDRAALRCQCRPRSGQETAKPDAQLASVVIQTTITACLQMNVQTEGPQFDGQATERDRQTDRQRKQERQRERELTIKEQICAVKRKCQLSF